MKEICNINLIEKKEQLKLLLDISKDSLISEEALIREKELKTILETNDELEDVDIKGIGSLEHFLHRAWLFEYKGRGYILLDMSNGHYDYCCTAEDLMCEIELSETFFENIL